MCCSCFQPRRPVHRLFPAHAQGSAGHSGQRASLGPGTGVRRHTGLSFADGSRQPLCSFAGQDAGLFASLPSAAGVGIALQMQDGSTRVLRMSHTLEQHLQQEWTPYLLANAADIRPDEVLRALVYQDNRSIPLTSLLERHWATAPPPCWVSVQPRTCCA